MDKTLQIKVEEQNKAIKAVVAHNYNAIVLATVGYGKGRVMLELVKRLVAEGRVKTILHIVTVKAPLA